MDTEDSRHKYLEYLEEMLKRIGRDQDETENRWIYHGWGKSDDYNERKDSPRITWVDFD
jgi:hypothetical protein